MVKRLLVFFLLLISITPQNIFARDPYPSTSRNKYIIPPESAQQPYDGTITDPQTMIRTNGKRADIISFSCYDGTTREEQLKAENRKRYIFLTDPAVDTIQEANSLCAPKNPPYTVVKPPYLKNNKQTSDCQGKEYDINCYDWPIGNFIGPHPKAGKGSPTTWVNHMPYASFGGPINACGLNKNEKCDCQFLPYGPAGYSWMYPITRVVNGVTERCVSPPYSISGNWWNWNLSEMDNIKNSLNMNELTSVNVYFGIDGEGRPFKSDQGWGPDPGFFSQYVPAVIAEVKKRYPGKTIRAHYTRDIDFFLKNDIDFHWESLSSDGGYEYLYKDITYDGLDEMYQKYFTKTNTLGLNPDWGPYYQAMLSALTKHTDGVTGFPDVLIHIYQNGSGDFIKFAGSYIGRDINDTPGVWDYLRETSHPKEEMDNRSGKYGDDSYYLYRPEELENNHTVPVSTSELPAGTSQQIYNVGLPSRVWPNPDINQYVGRKNAPGNSYMSFDVDDGWRFSGRPNSTFDVRIVYLDVGTETLKFQYKDSLNNWKEYPITKTNTQLWQEKTFEINNAYLNNSASESQNNENYPTDVRIQPNGSTIHLIEIRGKENVPTPSRPKAQVSCNIVRNESDNPLEGISSVGINQDIKVKAVLHDQNGNPLPNERIMFTYNVEWLYANSQKTNSQGIAFYNLNTANKSSRSGFLGNGSNRPDKPSRYFVTVYYPGSSRYQPSRNDCTLLMTSSPNTMDPKNTKIKITGFDETKVTYQVIAQNGTVLTTKTETVGKGKYFNPEDPNAQTINIIWTDPTYYASFNNFTLHFGPTTITPPFTPSINLKNGWNVITLPRPAFPVTSSNLPSSCLKLTLNPLKINQTIKQNYRSGISLQEGAKYNIFCAQNAAW